MNPSSDNMYSRTFWLACATNVLLTTANSLLFRFAEFVTYLGGTEELTGQIISVALAVSLVWRLFLGQTIDLLGVRRIWLYSFVAYGVGGGLLLATHHPGWMLYAGRALLAVGVAGMFACAMSHIQTLAPPQRRTEIIATYGTSGYVGMMFGSQLGDLILNLSATPHYRFVLLFSALLLFGFLHTALATGMTWNEPVSPPTAMPGIHHLLLRYWSPLVMLVAMALGMGFVVTMVFLTRFATERGLGGIRTFFTAYAVSAFLLRLIARNWSRTTGRHKLIIWGLLGQASGFWMLGLAHHQWQLILPAIGCGFGHALIFACVMSLGAEGFPPQYRGTGTTITLACIDLGMIVISPLLGWLIDHCGFVTMLNTVSGILLAVALFYWVVTFGATDSDIVPAEIPDGTSLEPPPGS